MRYIALLALAACIDSPDPAPDAGATECTAATVYQGPIVECDGGAGVCIAYGERIECRERCAEVGDACAGAWWRSTHTAEGNVCYCEPH